MPVLKLTRRSVASLPAVERQTIYFDEVLKGFGLKVMPSGSRSWIVEYRPGAGGRGVSKRRMVIGDPAVMSPDDARDEAGKILSRVNLGEDPAAKRTEERKAETVSDLLDAYMSELIRPKRKPRTAVLFDGYATNHIAPAIGSKKVNAITQVDVARLHKAVGARHKTTANRILTLLNAAFAFGIKTGRLPKGFENPVGAVERYGEKSRERYLTADELARLGHALRLAEGEGIPWTPDPDRKTKHAPKAENRLVKFDQFAVAGLRLLMFTGARLREILHLRWSEVDMERGFLFLPDSKTGKKTIVLGAPALRILAALPRLGIYVIAGETAGQEEERPRSDLNRPWARISAHAGLTGVRLHDLRHSFASVGAGSGMGLQIVGRLLGHADISTTERYAHLADDPLKRASDMIAGQIAAAMGEG